MGRHLIDHDPLPGCQRTSWIKPPGGWLQHVEYFHDHQRIERTFFDGALDPYGGVLTPDPDQPGLGLTLRESDAERYRRS